MDAKDIRKGDVVLTPEGQELEVTWKKLEVIQVRGGRMYMAADLRPAQTPRSSD